MEMMRDRGIIYYPDASGRDTYIYNDDGGFNKIKEVRPQHHPGTMFPGLEYQKKAYAK